MAAQRGTPPILRRFIRKPPAWVDLACFRQHAAVLAYDLERRRRLRPPAQTASRCILVMAALNDDNETMRLFRSLMRRALQFRAAMIPPLQPFALRLALQTHLDQRRRSRPESRAAIASCKLFLLNEGRCYSLNDSAEEELQLYRRSQALTYHVGPAHFLPLEANDVLLIASPTVTAVLRERRPAQRLDSARALESLTDDLRARAGAGPLWETAANYLIGFRFSGGRQTTPGDPTRQALLTGRLWMTLLYGGLALLTLGALGGLAWWWALSGR